MKNFLEKINDPALVGKFCPIIFAGLFIKGYIDQVIFMILHHTAKGQSIVGWGTMIIALLMYIHFCRICCPKERIAFWAGVIELIANICTIATVVYFQHR